MLASGIAITKKGLRILTLNNKKGNFEVAEDKFVPFEKGVIVNGQIKDVTEFQKALKKLKANALKGPAIHPSISVPDEIVYFDNYQFPVTEEMNIAEMLNINAPNILPFSVENSYFSYQQIEPIAQDNYEEVIFAAARKDDINPYIENLSNVLAAPLSVETEALAFGRFIQTNDVMISAVIMDDEQFNILIIEKNSLRFAQGYQIEDQKNVVKEIASALERVINFYSVETKREIKLTKIYLAGEGANKEKSEKLANEIKIDVALANPGLEIRGLTEPWKKIIALSLTLRGFISEKEDTNLTLLPFGARELYLSKRAINFLNTVGNLATVFGIGLVALYLLTFLIFQFYSLTLSNRLISLSRESPVTTAVNYEKAAKDFNQSVKILANLETNHYTFAPALDQIKTISAKNQIALAKIVITDYNEPVVISGTAPTRESIIDLKRDLEQSNKFTEIQSPVSALEQKTNINFNLLFKIKPETIFIK